MTRGILLFIASVVMALSYAIHDDPPDDTERLGRAIDYFQSGKYHEALLIFEELDEEYDLNPRYHAYMGICYYHEWSYPEACKYLDEAIPQLEGFAPHERSVYYFTDGESHFQLQQYHEAIPYFEKAPYASRMKRQKSITVLAFATCLRNNGRKHVIIISKPLTTI